MTRSAEGPDLDTCLEPDRHWPEGEDSLGVDWCEGCGCCAACWRDTCPGHDGICPSGQLPEADG